MTRAHKISNLFGAIVPFLAFIAANVLLWNRIVDWSDLAVLAIMYVLTGLGAPAHRCRRVARGSRSPSCHRP